MGAANTLKRLKTIHKPRIILFQGSPRNKNNCPDQNSKTHLLAQFILNNTPNNVEIDYCDLSIQPDRSIIQPCKGCVSTANGYQCHYPCDCYSAGSDTYPDLMHDDDIYRRLERADGFLVLSPVHWYSVTTEVKAMFDRLVCCNLTLTAKQAKEFGIGKNAEKSISLEQTGELNSLLKNHYAGKYGAFFIHGDNGGVDYEEFDVYQDGQYHPNLPPSFMQYAQEGKDGVPTEGKINSPKHAVMPIVWQCRYSGIFVPDDLIVGMQATTGVSYSEAMKLAETNLDHFYLAGLDLFKKLIQYLS